MIEALAATFGVGALFALLYAFGGTAAPFGKAPSKPSKRERLIKTATELPASPEPPTPSGDPIPFGEDAARTCTLCGTDKGVQTRARPSRVGNGILTLCACKACFEKYT